MGPNPNMLTETPQNSPKPLELRGTMSGSAPRERHGGRFDKRKRSRGAASTSSVDESEQGIEMTDFRVLLESMEAERAALHSPIASQVSGVYNMQSVADREKMAAEIWTADFTSSMEALKAANAPLVAVLEAQMVNTTRRTEISGAHKQRQLEGILLNLVRAQSIHKVPILSAALSILCEANLVKREFHDAITFMMKGALLSETWTENFMKKASQMRPAPTEPMIPGVMVTVFDNLTMNVAYHSMCVGGETGEKLDMTNWFAVRVPQLLAPAMDGMQSCVCSLLEPRTSNARPVCG